MISTAESARSSTLDVQLGGQAIEQAQQASLGFATVVGIAAAIVILLISFGSFSAMGLPIATALLGLGAGIGVITLASHVIDMPSFASELALMIGLGVGVDYALFIVTRFRENYRTNGGDVEQAVEAAINTSGRAVLFAGVTVVIALLGMFALGVSLLSGAAVAASIGVVLVLAASLTLLPALLSLIGRRVGEAGGRQATRRDTRARASGCAGCSACSGARRVTAVAATALMLVLAAPALGLRLASSDAGNDPTQPDHPAGVRSPRRRDSDPASTARSSWRWRSRRPTTRRRWPQLTHAVRSTPGVVSVATPRLNAAGTAAAVRRLPDRPRRRARRRPASSRGCATR